MPLFTLAQLTQKMRERRGELPRRMFAGLSVTIENPAGTIRSGVNRKGQRWSTMMHNDYGYLNRGIGADGEGVDVFLGPDPLAHNVFVVHQNDPATGQYDEDKAMLGFVSPEAAKAAYLANYDTPEFYRSMTIIPMETFRRMLTRGAIGGVHWKKKHRRDSETAAMFSANWEEQKHPRGKPENKGRFGHGGGSAPEKPAHKPLMDELGLSPKVSPLPNAAPPTSPTNAALPAPTPADHARAAAPVQPQTAASPHVEPASQPTPAEVAALTKLNAANPLLDITTGQPIPEPAPEPPANADPAQGIGAGNPAGGPANPQPLPAQTPTTNAEAATGNPAGIAPSIEKGNEPVTPAPPEDKTKDAPADKKPDPDADAGKSDKPKPEEPKKADAKPSPLDRKIDKAKETLSAPPKRHIDLSNGKLPDFAKVIQHIADGHPVGFGDNKVFTHHVFEEAKKLDPALTPDNFKQRLKEANQGGLLRLSRADLVSAMHPDDVKASTVNLSPWSHAGAPHDNSMAVANFIQAANKPRQQIRRRDAGGAEFSASGNLATSQRFVNTGLCPSCGSADTAPDRGSPWMTYAHCNACKHHWSKPVNFSARLFTLADLMQRMRANRAEQFAHEQHGLWSGPAHSQSGLWDEAKHPRDKQGEFAKKEGGGEAEKPSATSIQDAWSAKEKKIGGNHQSIEASAKHHFAPLDRALNGGEFKPLSELVKGENEHRTYMNRHISALANEGHLQRAWDKQGNTHYGKPGAKLPAHLTQSDSPAPESKPPVDTSRQLGIFAKDVQGSPVEIGAKVGQADLFNRGKYKLGEAPAEPEVVGSKNASDPKHTGEMFPEKQDKETDAPSDSTETIQQQYDDLLEQRGLAAQEEGHYRNLSYNNRAKHAAKLAAVGKRYDELEAQIAAMAKRHPEVLDKRAKELDDAVERSMNFKSEGTYGDPGHFVTIDHHVVFIADSAGAVPERLKATGADKRFSKAHLERKLIQHHESVAGKGTYSADDEKWIHSHSAGDPFTFHKHLPTEVKSIIADNPATRRLFNVTHDARKAGGSDALGADQKRYESIANAIAGSSVNAAKETAHKSQDPGMNFLAHVHDNLPRRGEGKLSNIHAPSLRIGDQFKIGGVHHRVAEDAEGYRVLQKGKDYLPIDALPAHIPHDVGSFRPGRPVKPAKSMKRELEDAPFSARPRFTLADLQNNMRARAARIVQAVFGNSSRNRIENFDTQSHLWDEAKHPRGMPGNAGEFAPAKGGSKASPRSASRSEKAVPGELHPAEKIGSGKESRLVMADGSAVPAHITPGMIAPAYRHNLRISKNPDADVWAVGQDANGNEKPIYNPAFTDRNAKRKWGRTEEGVRKIGGIRSEIHAHRAAEGGKNRNEADAAWLMAEQATRPGGEADRKGTKALWAQPIDASNIVVTPSTKKNGKPSIKIKIGDQSIDIRDEEAKKQLLSRLESGGPLEDASYWLKSHGATTLEGRHIVPHPDGGASLQFMGKESVWHDHKVANPELAKMLLERKAAAGHKGKLFGTNYGKTAKFVGGLGGGKFSPKDLRTIRANELARQIVGTESREFDSEDDRKKYIMDVGKQVSRVLGNRPAQALKSYINTDEVFKNLKVKS